MFESNLILSLLSLSLSLSQIIDGGLTCSAFSSLTFDLFALGWHHFIWLLLCTFIDTDQRDDGLNSTPQNGRSHLLRLFC